MVQIPENLAPEQAATLLCAGVTAYRPLKQFRNSDKVLKAGILGFGINSKSNETSCGCDKFFR